MPCLHYTVYTQHCVSVYGEHDVIILLDPFATLFVFESMLCIQPHPTTYFFLIPKKQGFSFFFSQFILELILHALSFAHFIFVLEKPAFDVYQPPLIHTILAIIKQMESMLNVMHKFPSMIYQNRTSKRMMMMMWSEMTVVTCCYKVATATKTTTTITMKIYSTPQKYSKSIRVKTVGCKKKKESCYIFICNGVIVHVFVMIQQLSHKLNGKTQEKSHTSWTQQL